jgi:DNA gyrase subunit A
MSLYRRRMNAGRSLAGMDRYESDYLEHVFPASTGDTLMFLSEDGQAYWLSVGEIPEASGTSRGRALPQLLGMPKQAHVAAMLSLAKLPPETMLVFFTEKGLVKRTALSQFASQRSGGIAAIGLKKGDRLLDVQLSDGGNDVVLVSRSGRVIRFPEEEVSEVGRTAQGVRGIRAGAGDRVVGGLVVRRDGGLCLISENGFVHRLALADFSPQKRDGLGVQAITLGTKTGKLVSAREILPEDELMVTLSDGQTVRVSADDLPIGSRGASGEKHVPVPRGAKVVEVTRVASRRGEASGGSDEEETDDAAAAEQLLREVAASAGGEDQFDLL